MDIGSFLYEGFIGVFSVYHIVLIIGGLAGGIIIGTIPGLTAVMGITLMMPFTVVMPAQSGLVMLGAIYCGAIYGGANSAILLNTPGTPSAIATSLDGYPLTKLGRAHEALFGSLLASVIGGLFGAIVLMFFFAPLANFSLKISAPEYFWLCIFGLTTIAAMSPGKVLKGIIGGLIGLFLGTVGLDPFMSQPRFIMNIDNLILGVHVVPAMIGVFSFSQMINLSENEESYIAKYSPSKGVIRKVFSKFFADCKINLLRSSLIGTFVGMLPGAGGAISSLIAYNQAKSWDNDPDKYGNGALEGVVAAESANNAQVGGSLIPMMGLGIPGSPNAAIIMGGLLAHGIRPGSQLLRYSGDIAYTFIWSLILANILMLFVGYILIQGTATILKIKRSFIIPGVIVISIVGAFAIRNHMIDIYVMASLGIIGYLLSKIGINAGPIALGIILGPIAERNLGYALTMARVQPSVIHVLVLRPFSALLIILSFLSIFLPIILKKIKT